jgi:hypothetical protein
MRRREGREMQAAESLSRTRNGYQEKGGEEKRAERENESGGIHHF